MGKQKRQCESKWVKWLFMACNYQKGQHANQAPDATIQFIFLSLSWRLFTYCFHWFKSPASGGIYKPIFVIVSKVILIASVICWLHQVVNGSHLYHLRLYINADNKNTRSYTTTHLQNWVEVFISPQRCRWDKTKIVKICLYLIIGTWTLFNTWPITLMCRHQLYLMTKY